MSKQIRQSTVVPADPDAVWAIVGNTAEVAAWVPAIESSSLEGDVRTATFVDGGGTAHERIVAHDDAARSYTYSYLDGPLPLESYESTVTVTAEGDGSRVDWNADFSAADEATEAQLVEAIDGIYASSLAALADRF